MRNIFIDLGAGSGDDIEGYFKLDPKNKLHEVFAWEANSDRIPNITKRFPFATVVNAAAGITNDTQKFFLGSIGPNSSSLLENKVNVGKRGFRNIEVKDYCQWMKENFTADDYITMVIDIEGSEYELLSKMYAEGLFDWINQFYVEFHGKKLEGFDMKVEDDLADLLINKFGNRVYIYERHQSSKFVRLNNEGT